MLSEGDVLIPEKINPCRIRAAYPIEVREAFRSPGTVFDDPTMPPTMPPTAIPTGPTALGMGYHLSYGEFTQIARQTGFAHHC